MAGRLSLKNRNGRCLVLTLLLTFAGVYGLFHIADIRQIRSCKCESSENAQKDGVPGQQHFQIPEQPILSNTEHDSVQPPEVDTEIDVPPPLLPNTTLFELLSQHILVEPQWVKDRDWGLVEDGSLNKTKLKGTSADEETEFAWDTFFHGMTRGLFLELGGMNGKAYSVSLPFEAKVGWRSILIEGYRDDALQIPKNRPSSLSLQLVVCEQPSTVHFVYADWGVGGILEFMAPDFVFEFHRGLLKDQVTQPKQSENIKDILDWEKVKAHKNVFEQQCLPLQYVFDRFEITHINFMVLDLEGGELGALKSLDFNRIQFDVMCVETNRMKNEKDPYIAEVVNYLTGKGYILFQGKTIGRNSWFVHPSWTRLNTLP